MLILGCSAALILALDQLTKWWVLEYLAPKGSLPVIPQVFSLTFVENTGIAFGWFQGHPGVLTVLITVSVFTLLVCTRFFATELPVRRVAYGFILGGALGNWIDRLRVGYVIDFLDFKIWPVFNVSDSFITIGVFLFIWLALKGR